MNRNQKVAVGAVVAVGVMVGWVEFSPADAPTAKPVPVRAGETLTVRTGEVPVVVPTVTSVAPERSDPEMKALRVELKDAQDRIDLLRKEIAEQNLRRQALEAQLDQARKPTTQKETMPAVDPMALKKEELKARINNLKQAGLGLRIFEDREGHFPETLEAFIAAGDLGDPQVAQKTLLGQHYLPPPENAEKLSGNPFTWIVMYEDQTDTDGKRAVLALDGSARTMDEKGFQEALKRQRDLIQKP